MMKDIFGQSVSEEIIQRIENLTPQSQPNWGKMNVAQMLAHLSVMYEMIYEPEKFPKRGALMQFLLRLLAKEQVVGTKPYPKNGRTVSAFVISDERDFGVEKKKLIGYIRKTRELGRNYFEGKASHSFGKLTADEWNNMFYKHINHHLTQFGV